MTIGRKDLSNCITDATKTILGQSFVDICLFLISYLLIYLYFPLFSEIFISIDAYASYMHIRPFIR